LLSSSSSSLVLLLFLLELLLLSRDGQHETFPTSMELRVGETTLPSIPCIFGPMKDRLFDGLLCIVYSSHELLKPS
ncbi:hypothetical protein AOLI_G00191590, partial [Acnodon oligacanthus]